MAFPDDWTESFTLSFNNTTIISSTLTDFPVPINLALLPKDFWDAVDSAGDDIAVSSDGSTRLPADLLEFDNTNRTGLLITKASPNGSSALSLTIHCGNASASFPGEADTYGRHNVYATAIKMYLPLLESPNTTSGGYVDRTSNSNDGTGTSMSLAREYGKVPHQAARFDGSLDYINVTSHSSIELEDDFSCFGWLRRVANVGTDGIFGKCRNTPNIQGWNVDFHNSGTEFRALVATGGTFEYLQSGVGSGLDFEWYFVEFVVDDGTAEVRTNRTAATDTSTQTITDNGGPFTIGRFYSSSVNNQLTGLVQGIQYYDGGYTDDWADLYYEWYKSGAVPFTTDGYHREVLRLDAVDTDGWNQTTSSGMNEEDAYPTSHLTSTTPIECLTSDEGATSIWATDDVSLMNEYEDGTVEVRAYLYADTGDVHENDVSVKVGGAFQTDQAADWDDEESWRVLNFGSTFDEADLSGIQMRIANDIADDDAEFHGVYVVIQGQEAASGGIIPRIMHHRRMMGVS